MSTQSSPFSPNEHDDLARELLKNATAYSREVPPDWDQAIRSLELAYDELDMANLVHGVETYLRLPKYLQKAGRYPEAIMALDALLTDTHLPFWQRYSRETDREYGRRNKELQAVIEEARKLIVKRQSKQPSTGRNTATTS